MKCTIPEISWHNRDPVLALDIQPNSPDGVCRLATAGTDTHVVIWQLRVLDNGGVSVEALSDLTRHTRAVNAVRFSPNGEILASADDEGAVILWRRQEGGSTMDFLEDGGEGGENKEQWGVAKLLRGHLEDVYDLSWSHCSQFLVSGSVDNTAILWDVAKGKSMSLLSEHKGFVQGVSWDPKGQYVATLCSDRCCRIYSTTTRKILNKMHKASLPVVGEEDNVTEKSTRLFYDDTLKSFCRRLSFSPDGELLLAPSGIMESDTAPTTNGTYVFSRSNPAKPVLYLPTKDKYTLAVRFCPVLYQLRPSTQMEEGQEGSKEPPKLFHLPYRMIFAVATQNAVLMYDTQQPVPFAKLSNIHYTRLSDIAWSSDGCVMVVSSTDGYCSLVSFSPGELGEVYQGSQNEHQHTTLPPPQNTASSKEVDKPKKEAHKAVTPTDKAVKSVDKAITPVDKTVKPSDTTPKKPMVIRRAGDSSKSGKRVSLITLSGPGHKSDDKTKVDPSQPHTQPQQEEEMEVEEEVKQRFEAEVTSPTKVQSPSKTPSRNPSQDPSPSKTPNRTSRRVSLITLSSPKGKKNQVGDPR